MLHGSCGDRAVGAAHQCRNATQLRGFGGLGLVLVEAIAGIRHGGEGRAHFPVGVVIRDFEIVHANGGIGDVHRC